MEANTHSLHHSDLPASNLVIKPIDQPLSSTVQAPSPSKKQKRIKIIQPKDIPREEDCHPMTTKRGVEEKIMNQVRGTSYPPPPCDNTKEEKSAVVAKPWSLRSNRKQVVPWTHPEPKPVIRARMKKARTDEIAKKPKFSVALTRKEIEEDFIAMTNQPPPKKPKKHPKATQQHIDNICPSTYLKEVTPKMYVVSNFQWKK